MVKSPSSILFVGSGPLPSEKRDGVNAGGLRTAQFLDAIPQEYNVSMFVVENEEYTGVQKRNDFRHLRHVSVSRFDPSLFRHLRHFIRQTSPIDMVVGINFFPCFLASKEIPKDIPFWADMNGWALAEKQAQAAALQSNAYIPSAQKMERTILARADKISVVSNPQKYAVFGEMAMLGLLTKDNFCHSIVEVVENSCRPLTHQEKTSPTRFRGNIFPQNAIVATWIGGMNAWADEKTLFEACEIAMAKMANFHFVMTGESLLGIDEESYPRFQKRVAESRFHERFHLLGWIPSEQVPSLLSEANMGINVDRFCIETETGARNRINEMLRFGLPIVTTAGSEIAEYIEQYGAGKTCPSGSSEEIAQALITLGEGESLRQQCSKAGQTLIETRFSGSILQRSFCDWITNPVPSPKIMLHHENRISAGISYLRHRGISAFGKRILRELSARLP